VLAALILMPGYEVILQRGSCYVNFIALGSASSIGVHEAVVMFSMFPITMLDLANYWE
jgi:hypothetical protein